MISKTIKMMKEKKSPGIDGNPPKLLKEIIDQMRTPLAIFVNVSHIDGMIPSE